MSKIGMARWMVIGAATALAACASSPANGSSATAYGSLGPESQMMGVWLDSAGGLWMDSVGVIHHGRRGPVFENDYLRSMTDQNIVEHLISGDSMEIALSQIGVSRATNPEVRAFAQKMIDVHSRHLNMSLRTANRAGLTPMAAPVDTMDYVFVNRMEGRLSNLSGSDFDKGFMSEEVVMHRHMMSDLKTLQEHATGTAQTLVTDALPVVHAHQDEAQKLWRKIGGKASQYGTSAFPGGL